MTILETLAQSSRERVIEAKKRISADELKSARVERGEPFAFEDALKASGISFICEVKRASPSKGIIAKGTFDPVEIAVSYEKAGAAAISVLTEPTRFMGELSYLRDVSNAVAIPTLRKDFIIDEYQIYEAYAAGACAVLLICALLGTNELARFIAVCDGLGISALTEAHDEREVNSALAAGARVIGVNNRDLRTFEVDINTAIRLRGFVPPNVLFVAESGIGGAQDIARLAEANVDAALIGESAMLAADKTAFLRGLR